MNIYCPRCQSQQITKATAIINAGTATGTTRGVGIASNGEMASYRGITHIQSMLARKLAPPTPPKMATSAVWIWTIVCSVLGVLSFCSTVSNLSTFKQPNLLIILYGSLFGIYLLGLLPCVIYTVKNAPRRKARYLDDTARWQHAMYNWNQLYYCHTCDSVHLLYNRAAAPLEQTQAMLFNA